MTTSLDLLHHRRQTWAHTVVLGHRGQRQCSGHTTPLKFEAAKGEGPLPFRGEVVIEQECVIGIDHMPSA